MKKILWLLLLLPGIAAGQIYIDSYKFAAAAANDLLLDSFPGATVAFSLRKLDKDYTGNCIQVRRVSDNTASNIGFVDNFIDTVAIKNFCGTASTDTCFVSDWYDQSGNNFHFTQATNTRQPIILRGGALRYATTGELSLFFNRAQNMAIGNSTATFKFIHNGDNASIFSVYQAGVSSNPAENYVILDNCNGYDAGSESGFYNAYFDAGANNNTTYNVGANGALTTAYVNSAANVITPNQLNLISEIIDANNATAANRSIIKINQGTDIKNNTSTAAVSAANATGNLTLGSTANSGGFLRGFVAEIIIYNSDQTSNRTAISTNINTFYSIY